MTIEYANAQTPKPSDSWKSLSSMHRQFEVNHALRGFRHQVTLVDAKEDGHIILSLVAPLPADERGELLLDIEEHLKSIVDEGLTVWLDPQGDKSSLRKLRGIEIK
jgi:hypothetical protein